MSVFGVVNRVLGLAGYRISRKPSKDTYEQDGLVSIHNHDFMQDPEFCKAYQRGMRAASGDDYYWHWRVYIGLWTAFSASKIPGDFVECGVNRGFLSSAIMEYLNWNSLSRTFYLLDTFSGIDPRYVSDKDVQRGALEKNKADISSGFYTTQIDGVRANFSEWKNVQIVQGSVPETLKAIQSERIAYLHLDMNCSPPEVAALEYLWPRIAPGGFVLMDDYAYRGFEPQKIALDAVASARNVRILSIPTGQGLLIKPATT